MPTWMPADPLTGTPLEGIGGRPFGSNQPSVQYVDVSMMDPDSQFAALQSILESADLANPAQDTLTPPGTMTGDIEGIDPDQVIDPFLIDDTYAPPADLSSVDPDALQDIMHIAPGPDIPERHWYNDPQVHGLGVPPGYFNDQAYETGHSQNVLPNPAAEQGWDAWSGRPASARVAQMQNANPFYSAGVNRGLGERSAMKIDVPLAWQTQMYRQMLRAEFMRRGVHEVVISDVPSVPWTEQVTQVDPMDMTPAPPIGEEGVLPF